MPVRNKQCNNHCLKVISKLKVLTEQGQKGFSMLRAACVTFLFPTDFLLFLLYQYHFSLILPHPLSCQPAWAALSPDIPRCFLRACPRLHRSKGNVLTYALGERSEGLRRGGWRASVWHREFGGWGDKGEGKNQLERR